MVWFIFPPKACLKLRLEAQNETLTHYQVIYEKQKEISEEISILEREVDELYHERKDISMRIKEERENG
jgi:hypothetical protein